MGMSAFPGGRCDPTGHVTSRIAVRIVANCYTRLLYFYFTIMFAVESVYLRRGSRVVSFLLMLIDDMNECFKPPFHTVYLYTNRTKPFYANNNNKLITWLISVCITQLGYAPPPPVGDRIIVMSASVGLSVCVLAYLENHTAKLQQIFCRPTCCPWL